MRPNSRSSSFDRSSSSFGSTSCTSTTRSPRRPSRSRWRAALAQPEALARLRAGRHAQRRAAVRRRHVDARAERRFVNRNRHGDVQVVAIAAEQRMRRHLHRDVEIARGRRRAARRCPCPARGRVRHRRRRPGIRTVHRLRPRTPGPLPRRARTHAAAADPVPPHDRGSCARTPCARGPCATRRRPGRPGTRRLVHARQPRAARTSGSVSRRVTVTVRCAPLNASSNDSVQRLVQVGAALGCGRPRAAST